MPINIEIKGTADDDAASFLRTGRLLAKMLNKVGRTDVIVTSFNDAALVDFHALAPQIGLAPGRDALTAYFLAGTRPMEGTVALQVPVTFSGIPVMSKEFVAKAHADGYAVHVWFSGSAPDTAKTYNAMIDMCADGLMPARPTLSSGSSTSATSSARASRASTPAPDGRSGESPSSGVHRVESSTAGLAVADPHHAGEGGDPRAPSGAMVIAA